MFRRRHRVKAGKCPRSQHLGSQPRSVAMFCANHEQGGNDSPNRPYHDLNGCRIGRDHDDHRVQTGVETAQGTRSMNVYLYTQNATWIRWTSKSVCHARSRLGREYRIDRHGVEARACVIIESAIETPDPSHLPPAHQIKGN